MGEVETLRLLAKNGDHITPEETHSYLAKGKIGSREVVEELILGKQHHRAEDGSTIAHSAARGRRAEHLEVVLSSGVGFGAVDGNGNSMAHTLLGEGGARRHSQELVDYGLRRSDHTPKGIADCLDVTASFGVDLTARNFKGQNALETADPRNLSSDVVGRFRDAGLDLDHKDDEGKTLLDRAVEAGETNAVAAFGGAGADVGRHAGAVGLAMMEVGAAEDLRALGERGVDWISDVGPEKVPFIALEMTKGDPEAVAIETAIYAGVSFDVRDEGGHTPLSLAQEQGRHPGVILPLQIERREAVHGRVVAAVGEKVESTAVREDTQVAPAPSRRVGRSSEER
jgi:ankyrin repeat protein